MLYQNEIVENSKKYQAKNEESEWEFDPITPSQFHDRLRPDSSLQPEKRLMLAVLEEAIIEFKGLVKKIAHESRRRERRLLEENEAWFSSDDMTWPYSFENICNALQIDADYLRQGLKQWKQRKLEAAEAAKRQPQRAATFPPRPANAMNSWRPIHPLRPLAGYTQRRAA